MDYTQKLTYISLRRRNKLIKYKKYMRICLTVFTTSGGICGVLLLLGGLQNSFVGLLGASGFVCLFSSGIYGYLEKKYNKIRALTIESLMRQSPPFAPAPSAAPAAMILCGIWTKTTTSI